MLINGVANREGKKLADLPIEQVRDYSQQPGCFVCIALRDASDVELVAAQQQVGLHDLAVDDAEHSHRRTKIIEISFPSFNELRFRIVSRGERLSSEHTKNI